MCEQALRPVISHQEPKAAVIQRSSGSILQALRRGTLAAVIAVVAAMAVFAPQADARSSSSGGYSRSSGSGSSSGYSRTPSFGGSSGSGASSGGYSRSSPGSSSSGGYAKPPPSASDSAISRQNSGAALNAYRTPPPQQTAPSYDSGARTPSFASSSSAPWWQRGGSYDASSQYRADYYGQRGWSMPQVAASAPRQFGLWDAAFLYFMMSSLSTPSHAQFFYDHQNDPGVRAWQADAAQRAANDQATRDQLAALNAKVAQLQGQPRKPDALPPDVDPKIALAEPAQASSHLGLILVVVLVAGGVVFLLWLRRRHQNDHRAGASAMASPLSSAVGIIRHKLSGEGYKPSLFRVGMAITLDASPFILAAGATHVAPPEATAGGGSGLASVTHVGTLVDGGVTLHRLYVAAKGTSATLGGGFFQLHLDEAGQPIECRYFSLLDEITPANADEWGFWLDANEGAIGWPDFKTRDEKLYQRVWAPGTGRVAPQVMTETLQGVDGTITRTHTGMLYAASTGAADPAPQAEYILVAAVEAGGNASVQVLAGIDINPSALSLA
jgi:hypothetical protein